MSGGSTLPRRALGRRLRDLRLKAEKSLLSAAVHIDVSKQTIGRMEEGQYVRISTAQYQYLLDLYKVDESGRSEVMGLIQEAKVARGDTSDGWWRAFDGLVNPYFNHFMELERACSRMTSFQLTLLPGLLHTPAYRRWIMQISAPGIQPGEADRHWDLVARRQQRLTEDPDFVLEALISESALRHQIGGREVMAEQLRRLVVAGELPNVSIRAIPFGVGPHPGLAVQSFTLLEFPTLRSGKEAELPVVFVEGFTGALYVEEERVIERYRSALAGIREVALSEEATSRLVLEIAKEYGT
ncbi:DUF5753 domain-containing protein [Nocardia vaccinii]|uniref:DUF5753 domain-containing protein n=1 Tax=Nocardia vaccinii TaxID=1822 RepID=UPI0008372E36|nr:DUF5753 domain-containing protein [Nocardia vaccinii]